MRIGYGFDAHQYDQSGRFILGGVKIDCKFGIVAHSDGDVLIHAIGDALLGALALGDLGKYFPDHDNQYKNIDSRIILKQIMQMVTQAGWQIANIDSTIVAQQPRLASYIDDMRLNLAQDLASTIDKISIKATTTEKMGYTGRCEGIATHAVVLLMPR